MTTELKREQSEANRKQIVTFVAKCDSPTPNYSGHESGLLLGQASVFIRIISPEKIKVIRGVDRHYNLQNLIYEHLKASPYCRPTDVSLSCEVNGKTLYFYPNPPF